MAEVVLKNVTKKFPVKGQRDTLRQIDLAIRDGEFVVFVGPSGCGKSTLLRIIAGLEDITQGELTIDKATMNHIPPVERNVGMVFQSYALYPHMNVYQNMAFGLKLKKLKTEFIDKQVHYAAQVLGLTELLERKPKELSGGQRQRVAIGRAIVQSPAVFLFDEPLSNLDASLRVKMRIELAKLHQKLRSTMIYVTHDQVEAMTLADRIVVLSPLRADARSNLEQFGSPLELYHHPQNRFVAGFIGSPKMNFLRGQLAAINKNTCDIELGDGRRIVAHVDASQGKIGDSISLGIRPEHVLLSTHPHATNKLSGNVQVTEHLGSESFLYLEIQDDVFSARVQSDVKAECGSEFIVGIPSKACYVFDTHGRSFPRTAIYNREM